MNVTPIFSDIDNFVLPERQFSSTLYLNKHFCSFSSISNGFHGFGFYCFCILIPIYFQAFVTPLVANQCVHEFLKFCLWLLANSPSGKKWLKTNLSNHQLRFFPAILNACESCWVRFRSYYFKLLIHFQLMGWQLSQCAWDWGVSSETLLKPRVSRAKGDGSHRRWPCLLGRDCQLYPKHSHFSFMVSHFCPSRDTLPSLLCVQVWRRDWFSSMAVMLAKVIQKQVLLGLLLLSYLGVGT